MSAVEESPMESRSSTPVTGSRDVSVEHSDIALLLFLLGIVVAGFSILGHLVVSSSALRSMDRRVAEWFVDHRTPLGDWMSLVGSSLAGTVVTFVVTAVLVISMRLAWRRWRESLLVSVPLVFEATAFVAVTALVGRDRPVVGRLGSPPVDSDFPSGHVAVAVVYGAVVIVVFAWTDDRLIRAGTVLVALSIATAVGVSGMYRGMHLLSDVLAGAVLGLASLAAVWFVWARKCSRARPAHVVVSAPLRCLAPADP
jgi:undecaprenyl-diphosphatase